MIWLCFCYILSILFDDNLCTCEVAFRPFLLASELHSWVSPVIWSINLNSADSFGCLSDIWIRLLLEAYFKRLIWLDICVYRNSFFNGLWEFFFFLMIDIGIFLHLLCYYYYPSINSMPILSGSLVQFCLNFLVDSSLV